MRGAAVALALRHTTQLAAVPLTAWRDARDAVRYATSRATDLPGERVRAAITREQQENNT